MTSKILCRAKLLFMKSTFPLQSEQKYLLQSAENVMYELVIHMHIVECRTPAHIVHQTKTKLADKKKIQPEFIRQEPTTELTLECECS